MEEGEKMEEKANLGSAKKWLELSRRAFDIAVQDMTEEQKQLMRDELVNHFRKVLEHKSRVVL